MRRFRRSASHVATPAVPAEAALFASTRWTLVLAAAATDVAEDARANQALAELCRIYWRPLYLFLRRQGIQSEDAQDLTQSFFVELIESHAGSPVADHV